MDIVLFFGKLINDLRGEGAGSNTDNIDIRITFLISKSFSLEELHESRVVSLFTVWSHRD